jgi:hypothetical protein
MGFCVRGRHLQSGAAAQASGRSKSAAVNCRLLDAGHFALEVHADEIGALMRGFLERQGL